MKLIGTKDGGKRAHVPPHALLNVLVSQPSICTRSRATTTRLQDSRVNSAPVMDVQEASGSAGRGRRGRNGRDGRDNSDKGD